MKKFPILVEPQVALLRVNKNTGIVLDDQFNTDVSVDQKRFTVFESLNEANKYIESFVNERKDIEFVVYDMNQNILIHINK